MKSKKSFSDVQPWRVQIRDRHSLQDSLVIALGSTSSRAELHVRKFFPKSCFDIVDIFPITTSTMVAYACFCEQYANPLLSVDFSDISIHGFDSTKLSLTDFRTTQIVQETNSNDL